MPHQYKYGIMVDFLSPVKLGGSPDLANEPAQVALVNKLRELTNKLPSAIDSALPDEG